MQYLWGVMPQYAINQNNIETFWKTVLIRIKEYKFGPPYHKTRTILKV